MPKKRAVSIGRDETVTVKQKTAAKAEKKPWSTSSAGLPGKTQSPAKEIPKPAAKKPAGAPKRPKAKAERKAPEVPVVAETVVLAPAVEADAPEIKPANEPPKGATVVESFELVTGDAHAVLTVNGDESRWSPDQIGALRRRLTVAYVELH